MAKNYYDILGLTEEEKKLQGSEFEKALKSHYRKIALEKHPDRMQGASDDEKKKAEAEFKEASEAYDTLLNHREEYDNPSSGFTGGTFNFGNMDVNEILRHFHFSNGFDFNPFGDPFNMGRYQESAPVGASLRISIGFTLEEAMHGAKKKIRYTRDVKCHHCDGKGTDHNSKIKTCPTCGGKGMVYSTNGFAHIMRTCPTCGGKKTIIENPCPHCGGIGLEKATNEVEIEIPKGAMEGMQMEYRGLGSDAPHGEGIRGSLLVLLEEIDDERFVREGDDLIFDIEVNVVDALLGCDVKVKTLDGKELSAKIPGGTCDGKQMRFKGYGMPKYNTNAHGNMIGVVRVIMPTKLNNNEKKLLSELKKEEHFK